MSLPNRSPSHEDLPFRTLAHYEIVGRLGHGGMGDVYQGYERALDRMVAIKVLPEELAVYDEFLRRFRQEAAAAARLSHPNIVQVHFIGEDQGRHFFAMQYVAGQSLADLLARRTRLSIRESLEIAEQVLAGLGAAHEQGMIHRDIKPGNILLDRESGQALLADFGLVKGVAGHEGATATGVILGTADYMSPEQVLGRAVDGRSDLYSLAVVLYQMLSGRLPLEAADATAMMFQHAYEEPLPLKEACAAVPGSLARLVDRLLSKSPEDRPQSAAEVLSELQSLGWREWPAEAVAEDAAEVAAEAGSPAAWMASGSGEGAAAGWAGGGWLAGDWRARLRDRRSLVKLCAAAAVAAGLFLGLLLAGRWLLPGLAEPEAKPPGLDARPAGQDEKPSSPRKAGAISIASEPRCLAVQPPRPDVQGWKFGAGHQDGSISMYRVSPEGEIVLEEHLSGHTTMVNDLAFSPDGGRLASAGDDKAIIVWDLTGDAQRREFRRLEGHAKEVWTVRFSPDGSQLLSGSSDRTVRLWEMQTGNQLARFDMHPLRGYVRGLDWSPDGGKFVVGARVMGDSLGVWDLRLGRETVVFVDPDASTSTPHFSPDGRRVLCVNHGAIRIWDANTGQELRRFGSSILAVAFSEDASVAFSGSKNDLTLWDVEAAKPIQRFSGHTDKITCVALSADGLKGCSASLDETIRVWSLPARSQPERQVRQPVQPVTLTATQILLEALDYLRADRFEDALADCKRAMELSDDDLLAYVVRARVCRQNGQLERAQADLNEALRIQKDSASAWSEWAAIHLQRKEYREAVDKCNRALRNDPEWLGAYIVRSLARYHLGDHSLAEDDLRAARVLEHFHSSNAAASEARAFGRQPPTMDELELGRVLRTTRSDWDIPHQSRPNETFELLNPQGDFRVNVSQATVVRTLPAWWMSAAVLQGHEGQATGVAFSPDGRLLASSGRDGAICLWDTATWLPRRTLRVDGASVEDVQFSPDGRILASAHAAPADSEDAGKTWISLWDPGSGQLAARLPGRRSTTGKLAFSPDGETLAAQYGRWTDVGWIATDVSLWDLAKQTERERLFGDSESILSLCFSPDGKTLAVGRRKSMWRRGNTLYSSGEVEIWDLLERRRRTLLDALDGSARSVCFSPDGARLMAGCGTRLKVWSVKDGRELLSLAAEGAGFIASLAPSPDGRRVAYSSGLAIGLMDASSGALLHTYGWTIDDRQEFFGAAKRNGSDAASTQLNLHAHQAAVEAIAFSPDGRLIASAGDDATVRVWNPPVAASLPEAAGYEGYKYPGIINALAFSPKGKTLAVAGTGRDVLLLGIEPGRVSLAATLRGHELEVQGLAFSPDGARLASVGGPQWDFRKGGEIKIWDVASGKPVREVNGVEGPVVDAAVSPDGRLLATCHWDRQNVVRLWDAATGDPVSTLDGHYQVRNVAFAPDGKTIASGGAKHVRLWEVPESGQWPLKPQAAVSFNNCSGAVFSPDGGTLAMTNLLQSATSLMDRRTQMIRGQVCGGQPVFSPDGQRLATVRQGSILLWNVATRAQTHTLSGGKTAIQKHAFSPDGQILVAGCRDGTLVGWRLAGAPALEGQQKELRRLEGHSDEVASVAVSPDNQWLLSGGADKTARLWRLSTGEQVRQLTGHGNTIWGVAFSPDGKQLYTCSEDHTIRSWDAATGQPVRQLDAGAPVRTIAFLADGKRFVSGGGGPLISLWDADSGQRIRTIHAHAGGVRWFTVSPNGRHFLSADDKFVRLWDVDTGELVRELLDPPPNTRSMDFTSDGARAAVGAALGVLTLWNVDTGRPIRQTQLREHTIRSLTFFADDKWLLIADDRGNVVLQEVQSGILHYPFTGHEGRTLAACLSPDERLIVTGSADKTIRVWPAVRPR